MKMNICPRCQSTEVAVGAGVLKCRKCGYEGHPIIDKDFVKKG